MFAPNLRPSAQSLHPVPGQHHTASICSTVLSSLRAHAIRGSSTCAGAAQAAQSSAFVSVSTLQQWLEQGDVTVVDCRGEVRVSNNGSGAQQSEYVALRDAYLEGHIPVRTCAAMHCVFASYGELSADS